MLKELKEHTSMKNQIAPELVEAVKVFIGEEGVAFFKKLQAEHNTVSPVLTVEVGGRKIPHPVHFREGMLIRNFMRSSGFCETWDAHDLDAKWTELIELAIRD